MDLDTEEHKAYHGALMDNERPVQNSRAFGRLPLDVIQRILYTVDADTFASLTVLNQQWRRASNNPELYAHHVAQCPLYAAYHGTGISSTNTQDLDQLKREFYREIRKNVFQIFLRPRKTLVTLISSSVGSSAALPTGEALKFGFSANGHILLCLSSSRIFVLDLTAPEINVLYELKTSRMPLAATILDDGRVLAVVSHRHQINIYHLFKSEAKHVQVLTLNDVPRALALAPNGTVLGIAYDGSIEVHALGEDAIPTQCRAVRCGTIDTLSFSSDGSMLIGSSVDGPDAGFVTITAPFPTDSMADLSNQETHMWTTQILFPEVVSGYSFVTLLPSRISGDDDWIMGFDHSLKTFRAVRPKEPRIGSAYFPGPVSPDGAEECMPSLNPAVDPKAEVVALAFRGGGLFLYGLPHDLSATPLESADTSDFNAASTLPGDHTGIVARRVRKGLDQPSLFIAGRKVADISGLTAARWVGGFSDNGHLRQRLVAVAPGGVTSSSLGDETIPVDGGRISIFDFQTSTNNGETAELTIELGVEVPLVLREPDANLEQEVELERRRTQLRRGAANPPRLEARESINIPVPMIPDRRSQSSASPDPEVGDVTLFLEGPYSNTAPRSRDTLQRAATAAASNRRAQHVAREQERPRLPVLHIPHESDADNWVPPPPPYTRNPDQPLPEHLRQLLLPTMTAPPGGTMEQVPQQVRRASTNEADRPETSTGGGSGILSRRWSTRRRTADASDDAAGRNRLSFRPLSFHRVPPSNSHNQPIPAVHPGGSDRDRPSSTIPHQVVRESPTDSGAQTLSSGIPKRPFRNSRIFGTFRKSTSHGSAASQSNEEHQQYLADPSPRRHISIMRNGRFSRSSPNLAFNGNAAINRMSTIYSNASRSQNGGVHRTRSRSEAAQLPAPLTEEALQHALAMQQNASGRRLQTQSMPIHGHDQPQPTQTNQQQPPQEAMVAENTDWQQPNPTESDEWRARIEAWNMNTINERRKSKGKNSRCIVM
ncbi:F-box domain protein [Talaromyces stipitatus ATCC 10500]|uniref:F-box domain protein n=1 Tax=Talaromyces stipitatus (strain ATCC 10500 / CBS 375.48 / QM 6759 / NRRL 1006) TaxID=441959 RepID=B8M8B5_TALSN|nr:F-box domain protein [Talaromyces stipitatus ATCC 10500]EED20428.1 F-box domain protein [Talaromyces stipitatus ATCC 10500]